MAEDCGAKWCLEEDWCGLTCATEVLEGKWSPVILYVLKEDEPLRFNQLKKGIDGISSKVLSETLDQLTEYEVVEREVISRKPVQVEYTLSDAGESLAPIIDALERWGERHMG